MGAADDPASVTGGALRKVLCGGASLGLEVARGLEGFGVQVHGCYGLTECSPCVSVCAPGPFEPGDCGVPLACNRVGFSSFDMMVLCVRVEQELGRPVDFGALVGVRTVDDLVRAVSGGR